MPATGTAVLPVALSPRDLEVLSVYSLRSSHRVVLLSDSFTARLLAVTTSSTTHWHWQAVIPTSQPQAQAATGSEPVLA